MAQITSKCSKALLKLMKTGFPLHSHYLISMTALSDQKQHHTRCWFCEGFFLLLFLFVCLFFFFNMHLAEGQS